jgi:hypothetical protein
MTGGQLAQRIVGSPKGDHEYKTTLLADANLVSKPTFRGGSQNKTPDILI